MRLALRGLRRSPTFTIAVVLILGLGIGMAAAMATVFRGVLLDPLPVADAARLVVPTPVSRTGARVDPSAEDLADLRRTARGMVAVAGAWHFGAVASPMLEGSRALTMRRAVVTANLFDVLGARPAIGRLLVPADGEAGAHPVLVLSHRLWQRRFGGDPGVIGRTLVEPYTRSAYTIVGVAPAGLDYPAGTDAWQPMTPDNGTMLVQVVARISPRVTATQVRDEFLRFMMSVDARRGTGAQTGGAEVHRFDDEVRGGVRPALSALTAAVALLLLIACINVGGLLLLRASTRGRELAIRRAVGASTLRIVGQLSVECVLLVLLGGLLGVAFASGLLRGLTVLAPLSLPRLDVVRLGGVATGIALAVTTAAVLGFGILPLAFGRRVDLGAMLRSDSRSGTESRATSRVRRWLVVSQVALAVLMVTGAGLLGRSLFRLQHVPLGYDTNHLSEFSLTYPVARYDTPERFNALGERIAERVRRLPGVVAVSPILTAPFVGPNVFITKLVPETQPIDEAAKNPYVAWDVGGPELFRTLGIRIVRGRGFTDADRPGAPNVAVISEALAARYFPGQDPIGMRLRFPIDTSTERWTIVGVAADTRYRELRAATPTVYEPWQQSQWFGRFAIRTSTTLETALPALRRAVAETDPDVLMLEARTMDQLLAEPLAQPRLSALLMSAFGLAALLLSAVGLYGLMAASVRLRSRDLGVRLALGATAGRLARDVLARSLALTGLGVLIGAGAALATTRLLRSLLYEVSPTDPVTLLGVCLVLAVVATAAAWLPARRAMRTDPAAVLRSE